MKYTLILATYLLISACNKCEKCEVFKSGIMIENYEGCDEEAMKMSKEICEGSAKMQGAECICKDK
jgi:hypothetical protein